jgi:hypothetical protein
VEEGKSLGYEGSLEEVLFASGLVNITQSREFILELGPGGQL